MDSARKKACGGREALSSFLPGSSAGSLWLWRNEDEAKLLVKAEE
jgi:hypothetical protein